MSLYDGLLLTCSLLLLVGYHIEFLRRLRRKPLTTSFGFHNATRVAWVQAVMQERPNVLAIQTLRNWIMAASFMASAGIIIGLGIFNAALNAGLLGNSDTLAVTAGASSHKWLQIKLIVLGMVFFLAFFNFTLAIRYYIHVGYLINIPEALNPAITPALVANTLNRGAAHYTIGMRAFYIAIPLALWLFGEVWLLAGSATLLVILSRLDRATTM